MFHESLLHVDVVFFYVFVREGECDVLLLHHLDPPLPYAGNLLKASIHVDKREHKSILFK